MRRSKCTGPLCMAPYTAKSVLSGGLEEGGFLLEDCKRFLQACNFRFSARLPLRIWFCFCNAHLLELIQCGNNGGEFIRDAGKIGGQLGHVLVEASGLFCFVFEVLLLHGGRDLVLLNISFVVSGGRLFLSS